jgi:hypothetical protein
VIIIDGYPIDCAKFEDHNLESDVTEDPVESGSQMTHHVRALPARVSLECWVSDTPLGELVQARASSALLTAAATGSLPLPSEEAYARLELIHKRREPVTIETNLKRYDNMVLRSLSVPIDVGTGDALMFRAEFVEVEIKTNERTVVRVAVPRGKSKVNRGHKASEVKGTPPPAYLLRENNTDIDPRFQGANSGGRTLVSSGGDDIGSRVPIAAGGSGL